MCGDRRGRIQQAPVSPRIAGHVVVHRPGDGRFAHHGFGQITCERPLFAYVIGCFFAERLCRLGVQVLPLSKWHSAYDNELDLGPPDVCGALRWGQTRRRCRLPVLVRIGCHDGQRFPCRCMSGPAAGRPVDSESSYLDCALIRSCARGASSKRWSPSLSRSGARRLHRVRRCVPGGRRPHPRGQGIVAKVCGASLERITMVLPYLAQRGFLRGRRM